MERSWRNLLNKAQPADVIIIQTQSIYGQIIRHVTGDEWNHVAMVIDPLTGTLLEALCPRVKITGPSRYENGLAKKAVLMRVAHEETQKWSARLITVYAPKVVNRLYDLSQVFWMGLAILGIGKWISYCKFFPVLNIRNMLICSELVDQFYREWLKLDLFKGKVNTGLITPGMLFRTDVLYPVAFYVK